MNIRYVLGGNFIWGNVNHLLMTLNITGVSEIADGFCHISGYSNTRVSQVVIHNPHSALRRGSRLRGVEKAFFALVITIHVYSFRWLSVVKISEISRISSFNNLAVTWRSYFKSAHSILWHSAHFFVWRRSVLQRWMKKSFPPCLRPPERWFVLCCASYMRVVPCALFCMCVLSMKHICTLWMFCLITHSRHFSLFLSLLCLVRGREKIGAAYLRDFMARHNDEKKIRWLQGHPSRPRHMSETGLFSAFYTFVVALHVCYNYYILQESFFSR